MIADADVMDQSRADVGWIVGATVNVLRRRAVDLLLIGLPFVWLPNVLAPLLPPDLYPLRFATGVPALVYVGGASLVACRELTGGERLDALAALRVGLRRFWTLLLISLISGLMALVGALLLVVPGIFIIVSFMAASSIAVAEDRGSTAALERAWLLSRGSRGRLAALLGIALAIYVLMLVPVLGVGMIVAAVAGMDAVNPIDQFVLGPIVSLLLVSMTTVGSTAAYVNLRTLQEGPIELAETFA
jgi:hypothetical protein